VDVVSAAARGELPAWAVASPERRAHMGRVATLLGEWAGALGLPEREREEWAALGYLHDALRDAPEAELRDEVPEHFRDLPGPLLHGPAAAERLDGTVSPALLAAIRYHTVGHPSLDRAGKALYLADFLEPGRDFELDWRDGLSRRMPGGLDEVLVEVVAARIRHLLDGRRPIRAETAAFWSALVGRR
jgi:2-amino-4-hydroxy-6-hydroxymethyldihydropteridine diphosphokinase